MFYATFYAWLRNDLVIMSNTSLFVLIFVVCNIIINIVTNSNSNIGNQVSASVLNVQDKSDRRNFLSNQFSIFYGQLSRPTVLKHVKHVRDFHSNVNERENAKNYIQEYPRVKLRNVYEIERRNLKPGQSNIVFQTSEDDAVRSKNEENSEKIGIFDDEELQNVSKLNLGAGRGMIFPSMNELNTTNLTFSKGYLYGEPLKKRDESVFGDLYFVAIVAGCGAAAIFGVIAMGYCFYTYQNQTKAAASVGYPAYGVTQPHSKEEAFPSGDRKLAQSAQMYHYQHQKQQMIAVEKSTSNRRTSVSDIESEEENEEGDYTVYECPGLASTGEMEVQNPLFSEEPTHRMKNNIRQQF
ncbi:uncharacterized protein LOC106466550 [Limulus polyphemus]|uniref:Uncharacterized protein LOC106466550 n=1 Tax=Limulus polyphemus TaxID=6850 RepID=A0ABM1BHU3_LIMPO|nr:uncharacterized protein LOC106466550 [Limulus polyphemus]